MTCPTPTPAIPGGDATNNGAAAAAQAEKGIMMAPPSSSSASGGGGGEGAPPAPKSLPQTTAETTTTPAAAAPPRPHPPAADTPTGLISPLTLMKNKAEEDGGGAAKNFSSSFGIQKYLRSPSASGIVNGHHHHHHHPHPSPVLRPAEHSFPATTPQVDSYAISRIGQARERIKRSFDGSKLLERDEYVFPRFDLEEEISLGEVLGRGGFGTVMEIRAMNMVMAVPQEEERGRDDDDDDEGERSEGEEGEGGEKRGEAKNDVTFEEKSTFRNIDDVEGFERPPRRKKSHSFSHGFHFRRRGGGGGEHRDDRPGEGADDGDGKYRLGLSNSHDGCEGMSTSGISHMRMSINERASFRITRSHDCIEGDDAAGGGGASSSPMAAGENDAVGHGGNRRRVRETRRKVVSWSGAKAAAHDVSHFFHRSPKNGHHYGVGGMEGGGDLSERARALEEEEEKTDSDCHPDQKANELVEGARAESEGAAPRPASARHPTAGGRPGTKRPAAVRRASAPAMREGLWPASRRVSRNFSFVAWRDSEAGEEGNDALSPEDLKRFNMDGTFFCTPPESESESICPDSAEGGGDSDGNGNGEWADRRGDLPAIRTTNSGLRNEFVRATGSRRRIVMYSTPKDGYISLEPPEVEENEGFASVISNGAAHYLGHQDKSFIAQHATTRSGEARYVIKIISPHIVENDFKKFLQAAMDMATETYFLSVLNHPNILKMRAVGQGDMFSPGYFLVLDRLYETLLDRIEGIWSQQLDHLENSMLVWNRARKLRALWEERLSAMRDLAGALAHLHDLKIIYRDVKPENAGFDGRGRVKLFDFGLAKELHEDDKCANGTYKLTPCTGSTRYMAPENGNAWPYNFATDAYSFGIMLWEVAALERPFACYTPKEIRDMVMKWGERPKITRQDWSDRVTGLMTSAWDSNFRKRPTMRVIEGTLEKEIEDSLI